MRRWLKPPRTLRPTRAGWAFFAITLGVGLSALNTGNNLMYMVLALLLSFLVLSGVLSESALRGIRIRRRPPSEIFAERPAQVVVEITNDQRHVPAFAVVVEDLVGPDVDAAVPAGRAFALRIGPGETEVRSYALTADRRGRLRFAGMRIATRFPFGLFSKAMVVEDVRTTLVYPAVEPTPFRPPLGATHRGGETSTGRGGSSPETGGLRDYANGDPFRRVHWRATLRRGALLVRDQEQERSADHLVRLRTSDAAEDASFESAVSHATSEVVAHLADGFRVALRTDAAKIPAGQGARHRRDLLAFLATVAPDGARDPQDAREAAA
jgi:uncharacterized protein (DUF58 family)